MENYLKVVVTGEVDSGKSTMIGRFLYELGSLSKGAMEEIGETCQRLDRDFEFAYLLDSFEEERKGQLTIDTTQVFCKTRQGRSFVFIDVPGHKELLKNMLSGSSYADTAVLLVDVQKSIEEQTKRHAFILKFLGIEQIVLALNKMDAAGFKENVFNEVKNNAIKFFSKIGLEPGYFVPISAKEGDNLSRRSKKMPWYRGASLAEALNKSSKRRINGDFRFLAQDVYDLGGYKVVVGEIISGIIKQGERVRILPLDRECKVRAIRGFNKNRKSAMAPEGIGLVLEDMKDIKRGLVICKERLPRVTREISAKLFCTYSFSVKGNFKFVCLTQESAAKIKELNMACDTVNLEPKPKADSLEETFISEAVIVTENPVVVETYKGFNKLGRFVLRDNKRICAVGVIL